MPDQRLYRIAELAREFGVTSRTLRFYEDKGLLQPKRSGQSRLYSARDRARLYFIVRGKRLGLSLEDIRGLLDLYDLPGGHVSQLERAITKFKQRIDDLQQQRCDIDSTIAELEDGCRLMERLLAENASEPERVIKLAPSSAGFAGPLNDTVSSNDNV